MTTKERDVLLALSLHQMQGEDSMWVQECGVATTRIARTAGRTSQSTAATLSHMRDAHGWVHSYHGEEVGWFLVQGGVEALNRDAGRVPA